MTDRSPVIETNDLTRVFKSTRAVDGLTLSIAPGELFGLVGPDGAGKTTTLRLLAGLLDVSEGEATILGYDLRSQAEAIKSHTGYMAQQFSLYGELTVLENLAFFAELFDVSPQERQERTGRLLELAGLTAAAGDLIEQLGGEVAGYCFLVELTDLGGKERLAPHPVWSILKYPA